MIDLDAIAPKQANDGLLTVVQGDDGDWFVIECTRWKTQEHADGYALELAGGDDRVIAEKQTYRIN
mgnify:CR=1 FL=1